TDAQHHGEDDGHDHPDPTAARRPRGRPGGSDQRRWTDRDNGRRRPLAGFNFVFHVRQTISTHHHGQARTPIPLPNPKLRWTSPDFRLLWKESIETRL